MMDKLELALGLIADAIEEKRRLDKVTEEIKALDDLRKNGDVVMTDYWMRRWAIEGQFGAVPKKAHINDNIKIARRLLMEGRV